MDVPANTMATYVNGELTCNLDATSPGVSVFHDGKIKNMKVKMKVDGNAAVVGRFTVFPQIEDISPQHELYDGDLGDTRLLWIGLTLGLILRRIWLTGMVTVA